MNNNDKTMVFVNINDEPEDEMQAVTRAMQVLTGERDGQPTRRFRLDAEDEGGVGALSGRVSGNGEVNPDPSGPYSSTADAPLESFEDGFARIREPGGIRTRDEGGATP